MTLQEMFREGTGRPDMIDLDVDAYLNEGRHFIEENLEYGAEDWNEEVSPTAVVLAAMHKYELLYRNREAAVEHLEALKIELQSHNFAFIDDDSRLITRMEG